MKNVYLCCATLWLIACSKPTAPKTQKDPSSDNTRAYADTSAFKLLPAGDTFLLQHIQSKHIYPIPKLWLMPPKDPDMDSVDYEIILLELTHYDSTVTAFTLGKNLVGIHISSYDIADGGSMALAQGLDVFLAVDTVSKKVLRDVLHLGVTKRRSKDMGHFDAEYTHFLVNPFPFDTFYALGTFKEKIYFNDEDNYPYYEQTGLQWYSFDGQKWHYKPKWDKYLPVGNGGELPMLGLSMSPIEFVKDSYKWRYKNR